MSKHVLVFLTYQEVHRWVAAGSIQQLKALGAGISDSPASFLMAAEISGIMCGQGGRRKRKRGGLRHIGLTKKQNVFQKPPSRLPFMLDWHYPH